MKLIIHLHTGPMCILSEVLNILTIRSGVHVASHLSFSLLIYTKKNPNKIRSLWEKHFSLLLGALVKIRKATVNFVISVCPSVHTEQLEYHWTDFYEILYMRTSRKSVDKIKVWLESGEDDGYFI